MAQIKTVIPANTKPGTLVIDFKNPTYISFDLATIPPLAIIDSSKLQLVLNEEIINGMALKVLDSIDNAGINNLFLYPGEEKDKVINIGINTSFINASLPETFSIKLEATIDDDAYVASFYPANLDYDYPVPGYTPRLVVYYKIENKSEVNWASARTDAQHSAQTQNALNGAAPLSFSKVEIADFGSIQADLVMWNNLIYVVDNKNSETTLYSIDPITKSKKTVADQLPNINTLVSSATITMPVIDPFGRLYYFSENDIQAIDLSGNGTLSKDIPTGETLTANATIGADGSLYIITNIAGEDAYKVTAYSPYPIGALLWTYTIYDGTAFSSVSLNKEGTTAYIVSYKDNDNQLIAMDTNNGKEIKRVAVNVSDPGQTSSTTIPLVNSNGGIFVTNTLTNATNIAVFDANLESTQSISGDKISPLAMKSNGEVYFVMDDEIYRSTLNTFYAVEKLNTGSPDDSGYRSLITDLSNNIYCLRMDNTLYTYLQANGSVIKSSNLFGGTSVTQKAMIIAPDGSLYVCSSTELFALRCRSFNGNYELNLADNNLPDNTFRGTAVSVPDDYVFKNNQIVVGTNAVDIGDVEIGDESIPGNTPGVLIESGGTISFGIGFTVLKGAKLTCKTGY